MNAVIIITGAVRVKAKISPEQCDIGAFMMFSALSQ